MVILMQMKLRTGTTYKTLSGLEARITYVQPKGVIDSFPYIGHVRSGTERFGVCWAEDGRAGETDAYSIIETTREIKSAY